MRIPGTAAAKAQRFRNLFGKTEAVPSRTRVMSGIPGAWSSSGQGEKHQAKTSKKYSTENGGRRGGGARAADQLRSHADQQKGNHEIRSEQDEKDFAAVEIEDATGKRKPRDGEKQD